MNPDVRSRTHSRHASKGAPKESSCQKSRPAVHRGGSYDVMHCTAPVDRAAKLVRQLTATAAETATNMAVVTASKVAGEVEKIGEEIVAVGDAVAKDVTHVVKGEAPNALLNRVRQSSLPMNMAVEECVLT